MNFSQKEIEEIENLAGLCIGPKDIAIILERDIQDFIEELEDEDSQVYKLMYKGYLKKLVKYRELIFKGDFDKDQLYEQKLLLNNFKATIIKQTYDA